MNKVEMMGMLEKWLLQKAAQAKRAGGMGNAELIGAIGKKAGQGIDSGISAVMKNPLAAGIGGVGGAGLGYSLAGESDDEDEILRKYGLR